MNASRESLTAGTMDWRAFARTPDGAAWWAIGAWIRGAIAGALLAAAGFATLLSAPGLRALAMLAAGAALAAYAGRRAARRLATTESPAAPVPGVTSAAETRVRLEFPARRRTVGRSEEIRV